jgi:F-type H+-transporting ATPase subunit b
MRTRITAAAWVLLLACSSAVASTEAAAEESGGGSNIFEGSWADALWTVIAFGALMLVLGKYAWKPLLGALKEREDHIHTQITEAEQTRRSAERLLDAHKKQGQEILERATEQAVKTEREIVEKARAEATLIKQRAQVDIEHARTAAAQQLWEEAGGMVLAVGSEVIGRAMTPEDNGRLIDETIQKLRQKETRRRR